MEKEETQEKTAAGFDADAFKESILNEVNKTLNGALKSLKTDITKLVSPKQETKPAAETGTTEEQKPNPALAPEVNAELNKRDREMKSLRDTLDSLTKERDTERSARMESERVAAIKDAMAGIQFRDDAAAKSFFKIVSGDIARDEDGALIAHADGGPLPVADHIRIVAESLPGLMAARGMGGSGATGGKVSGKSIDIEDIKPGMSAEARDAAWKAAAQYLMPK